MLVSDAKKAKALSQHLKGMGLGATKDTPRVRAYLADTPAPSSTALQALIEPLVIHHVAQLQAPSVEITAELVKRIVQQMHSLPEVDKLEVSKGIRNANSFIYGGTKYGTHEMMHGAGSSSTNSTSEYGEVVSGSGTSWTLAHVPNAGTVRLFAIGQRLTLNVDYTISSANITTLSIWAAGTILADYQYT